MKLYDFKIENIDNELIDFNKYKNKIVLIVNVASKCGFTKQYEELENLYRKYKEKNFCIIAFPCRQFAFEEFSDNEKIKNFCTTKYNITFEIFSITKVKGKDISPLYKWLISKYDNEKISWNFEKFLINKNGEIIERFKPPTKPTEIDKYILEEIKKY